MHFGRVIFAAPDMIERLFRRRVAVVPKLAGRTTLYVADEDMAVIGRPSLVEVGQSYLREAPDVIRDIRTMIRYGESPAPRELRIGFPIPDNPSRRNAWVIPNRRCTPLWLPDPASLITVAWRLLLLLLPAFLPRGLAVGSQRLPILLERLPVRFRSLNVGLHFRPVCGYRRDIAGSPVGFCLLVVLLNLCLVRLQFLAVGLNFGPIGGDSGVGCGWRRLRDRKTGQENCDYADGNSLALHGTSLSGYAMGLVDASTGA